MTPAAPSLADVVAGAAVARFEPFDSDLLGMAIGRVQAVTGDDGGLDATALGAVARAAADDGYDQLLRRVPATASREIWALEATGFLLMDVGLTFARRLRGPREAATDAPVDVRTATAADIERLLDTMLDVPWGSRYEADPAYDRDAVRALQARWLRNSLDARADHVLIGHVEGEPAGYVTCRLVEEHGESIGEIDLVGTAPAYRGRGVAAAIVDRSLDWFARRVELVTVRTQATNAVAAGVYERAGMTLRHADMSFRLAVTQRGGMQ